MCNDMRRFEKIAEEKSTIKATKINLIVEKPTAISITARSVRKGE